MELRDFPRPKDDTGVGFHYYPDVYHYRRDDMRRWIPALKEMGTSWLTVLSDLTERIPEAFVRELIANHIEPVVRIYTPVVYPVDQPALHRLVEDYQRWGVHYLHIFNEPNLDYEWSPDEWSKPGLVERFMDIQLPALNIMAEIGVIPLFAPLAPGGAYWDLTFFKTAMAILAARAKPSLIERMGICVHNYALNRPLTWGKGGAARWPQARPYHTPPGGEDHQGFYLFEWYDEVVRSHFNRSLPQVCGENGSRMGDAQQAGFPPITPERHAQIHVAMSQAVMDAQVPEYYFNNAFWLLANGDQSAQDGNPFEDHAWFKADGSRLPAIEAMKAMRKHPRERSQPAPSKPAPAPDADKPLYHYVLLPVFEAGVSEWYWGLVVDYVKAFRPSCGFDTAEAQLAAYVTIVGNSRGISEQAENELREAGCLVERIAGRDGKETHAMLLDLAQRQQRFLSYDDSRLSGETPKRALVSPDRSRANPPDVIQEWVW
ncbi:MAG: hypothetical protein JW850_20925 [Thermoflexales bacterium]|nr:hypothetical protein [Thermoflexales bacterium]